MSHPLPPHLAKASEREAWVEAQAWRRCVESRRDRDKDGVRGGAKEPRPSLMRARTRTGESDGPSDLAGLRGLADRLGLAEQDRAALANGLGALSSAQRSEEIERLSSVAVQVELLAGLAPRPAPIALDASVRERAALSAPAAFPETSSAEEAPELFRVTERAEEELHNWMAVLGRVSAPTALDQFVEREIAALANSAKTHAAETQADETRAIDLSKPKHAVPHRDDALLVANASSRSSGAQWANLTRTASPAYLEPTTPPQAARVHRFKRIALVAAAIVCLAGMGLLIRSMTRPGSGSDFAVGSVGDVGRFSFRYIEVDLGSDQDADRPALRLLRGWASHINPSAIEKPSVKK